jgi:uncharacterized protein (TIGR02118 family)
MIRAVFFFNLPAGVKEADFENWYEQKHVPDLRKIKAIREFVQGRRAAEHAAAGPYQRLAEFTFDSLEDMGKAMESPEWQAATVDAAAWIADPALFVFHSARSI